MPESAKRGLFLELNDDDWADGFALKFFAYVRLSRAVWMLLQQSCGSVVMIGGTSGRIPHADYAIRSAVNAAQAAFGKRWLIWESRMVCKSIRFILATSTRIDWCDV